MLTSPILLWLAAGLLLGDALPGLGCTLPVGVMTAATLVAVVTVSRGTLGRRIAAVLLAAVYGAVVAEQVYHPKFAADDVALAALRSPLLIEAGVVDDGGGAAQSAR